MIFIENVILRSPEATPENFIKFKSILRKLNEKTQKTRE